MASASNLDFALFFDFFSLFSPPSNPTFELTYVSVLLTSSNYLISPSDSNPINGLISSFSFLV